jgi:hypothetical protein
MRQVSLTVSQATRCGYTLYRRDLNQSRLPRWFTRRSVIKFRDNHQRNSIYLYIVYIYINIYIYIIQSRSPKKQYLFIYSIYFFRFQSQIINIFSRDTCRRPARTWKITEYNGGYRKWNALFHP